MSVADSSSITVGSSATPDNNFKFLIDDLGGMTLKSGGGTNTVLSIDSAGVITFPNTTRTWQAVTRTSGTPYTNSTGRDIELRVNGVSAIGSIVIDGVTVVSSSAANVYASTVTIPNGAVYTITCASLSTVLELR